jgi:hypothetical protein
MSLIQYTKQFAKSWKDDPEYYGFLAILHQTSGQTWRGKVNKYLPFYDDNGVNSRSSAEDWIAECSDFHYTIEDFKLVSSESEYNQVKKSFDEKIKKLNDDLKKKGKYIPDPRDPKINKKLTFRK